MATVRLAVRPAHESAKERREFVMGVEWKDVGHVLVQAGR